MAPEVIETLFFLDADMTEGKTVKVAGGEANVLVARCPGREGPNEDAVAIMPISDRHGLIAVADGFGGHPAGDQAAAHALKQMAAALDNVEVPDGVRAAVVDGFERANEAVIALGVGAATTLFVMEIQDGNVRPYHVGDSGAIIVGQRGRIKLRSVAHSPVGYAVESGLINEKEAMHHEDRHVVSNMVGSSEMRIEVGARIALAPRDTLLLASDGLFDNVMLEQIVERVRKGRMRENTAELARLSHRRMNSSREGVPSKPDDLSIVTFRLDR